MRDVDGVAGACHFDRVALCTLGIPTFQVRADRSIASGHHHPARFGSPGSRGDRRGEIVRKVEHLRFRHESGLLGRQVRSEQFMKLSRIDIRETVRSFLYGARFGQVAWETLSVVSLILSSIWHVRRDVYQSDNSWIRAGFSKYGSSVAMSDKNAWSILQGEHTLRRSHIILE